MSRDHLGSGTYRIGAGRLSRSGTETVNLICGLVASAKKVAHGKKKRVCVSFDLDTGWGKQIYVEINIKKMVEGKLLSVAEGRTDEERSQVCLYRLAVISWFMSYRCWLRIGTVQMGVGVCLARMPGKSGILVTVSTPHTSLVSKVID